MYEPREYQTVKNPSRSKIEHVHVDMPKAVWDLVGELAKRYGVGKVDVIKILVFSEAKRLGLDKKVSEVTEA